MFEMEKKYIITNYESYLKLKKEYIKKDLLIQWYADNGERIRRIVSYSGDETWIKTVKTYISEELRREEEEVIQKPNLLNLNKMPVVAKVRYLILSDPEIIIDRLLNPFRLIDYQKNFDKIKYLLEIEEKNNKIDDLNNYLKIFLKDNYDTLEQVDKENLFTNKDFAGKYDCDAKQLIKYCEEDYYG